MFPLKNLARKELRYVKRNWAVINNIHQFSFSLQEAKAGGFVGENATYGEYLRNPCMPHVGALLDNVLALLR